jgi:short-subunit dehydrogenase
VTSPIFIIFAHMKRAIIIGASSGMGFEVAKLLLSAGWQLGIAARREDRLLTLQALAPQRVSMECLDVTLPDAPTRLLSLIDRNGGMDLFFYASGIGHQNRPLDSAVEMDTVRTNALGFTQMVDLAFNYFAAHGGGHLAAISSIAGTKGLGAAPSYSATKAFQNTYLQSLDQLAAMRKLNISITDIRPGFVDTDLLNDGHRYPLLMNKKTVARAIVSAIRHRRHIVVIDLRWRIITFFWRLVPNALWRHMKI